MGRRRDVRSADELPRDRYLIGSPEQVAAGVRALIERTGADGSSSGAARRVSAIELANRSLERFAKEVIPLVETAAPA